ncbi:MAG: hypothetical protein LC118_21260 [Dehalococcoidia bacterium]|nr:hypothetical protein [Dehalococcoidia bacterium]
MRPPTVLVLAFACLFSLVLVACSNDSTTAPAPADATVAKNALLTVADFPTGWTVVDSARSGSSPLEKCRDAKTGKNQTGEAESGSFTNGPASVRQTVLIYRSAADAASAMDSLANELGCAVNLMNTGKAETAEANISGAVAGTVAAPVVGDRTNAYRIKFHLALKASKAEADGYIDVVYVQSGRSIVGLVASNAYEPLAADVLNLLTSKAAAKLQG